MGRLVVAAGISLALVLAPLVLISFSDSDFAGLLVFIFLQFPLMLAGYVGRDEVSVDAMFAIGIVLAWVLWSAIMYAVLWQVDAWKRP